jgi:hypothetical protein
MSRARRSRLNYDVVVGPFEEFRKPRSLHELRQLECDHDRTKW